MSRFVASSWFVSEWGPRQHLDVYMSHKLQNANQASDAFISYSSADLCCHNPPILPTAVPSSLHPQQRACACDCRKKLSNKDCHFSQSVRDAVGYAAEDAVPREDLARKFAIETHYDGGYTPIAGECGPSALSIGRSLLRLEMPFAMRTHRSQTRRPRCSGRSAPAPMAPAVREARGAASPLPDGGQPEELHHVRPEGAPPSASAAPPPRCCCRRDGCGPCTDTSRAGTP